ncbi:hypothetical protein [Devosia sp.]|uniref:hypothetical protein n=1 Tax=Devosia sp. TaxID=1871048 RepID=UPI003A8DC5D1
MRHIALRFGEVVLAAVIVGLITVAWSGLTTGEWAFYLIGVVPLGLIWGLMLGALVTRDISMGLFVLLTVLTVGLVVLAGRYIRLWPLRVLVYIIIFGAQQFAMAQLFVSLNITA